MKNLLRRNFAAAWSESYFATFNALCFKRHAVPADGVSTKLHQRVRSKNVPDAIMFTLFPGAFLAYKYE